MGTVGNVYTKNMKIKNYDALLPPPSTTRGAVAAGLGTPDYYNQPR